MGTIVLITGLWLVIAALIINANPNFLSKLLFKAIPFILGLANIVVAIKMLGWA